MRYDRQHVRALSLTAITALLLLLAGSEPGYAQQGGLVLQLDTQYERSEDPSSIHGLRDVQTAGLSINAFGGAEYVGLSAYLDAHFGAGLQGGFAYRLALLPLGVMLYDSRHILSLGLTSGFQMQGVTAHQDFGVQVPVRASLLLKFGKRVLLDTWASEEIALSEGREAGSERALFGDELRAGLSLRIGKGGGEDHGRHSVAFGSGYFVGALYSERFGTEFWGLHVGHGMDMRGGAR